MKSTTYVPEVLNLSGIGSALFAKHTANANEQNHHASNPRDIAPALVRKTELQ